MQARVFLHTPESQIWDTMLQDVDSPFLNICLLPACCQDDHEFLHPLHGVTPNVCVDAHAIRCGSRHVKCSAEGHRKPKSRVRSTRGGGGAALSAAMHH